MICLTVYGKKNLQRRNGAKALEIVLRITGFFAFLMA